MTQSPITEKLFRFLRELKKNNHRDWFAENKTRYQQDVLGPAVELVSQLEKPLSKVAPMLLAIPKGHGGSIMRIYRDTRFGKDKTPYKTNVGISLRHEANKDIHAPGVYIHLDPKECFIGAGCWHPESRVLSAIRAAIDQDPKAWKRARDNKAFREQFELAGEKLKTSPRDYSKDHPMIDDLRRIDFISIAPLSQKDFTSESVVSTLIDRVKRAKPLMRFLCDAIDVPY
ncbi:MAG: DUF2461 domain-containing protein [Pirellulaceae bacterium]|nr:DUF2461 domain-containing protein [Pirellulaceae bacterium]